MVDVTADAIRSAHRRVPRAFRDSPQFISEPLSEEIGVPVVVKLETANPIGSFKGRGTWLAMSELVSDGKVGERHGAVVASARNFGQGVAYAGRAMGLQIVAATREMSVAGPTTVEPAAGAAWAGVRAAESPAGAIGVLVTGGNVASIGSSDGGNDLDAVPEDRGG